MTAPPASPFAGPLAPPPPGRQAGSGAETSRLADATHPPPLGRDVRRRLGRLRLRELADALPARDRYVVELLSTHRLVNAGQLRRLAFADLATDSGSGRVCRRSLQRLSEERLIQPVGRRVGGSLAGSSSTVFTITPSGRRLVAFWAGNGITSDRGVHEPGAAFVAHTLAVAELYVSLVERSRSGALELVGFTTEPDCWRTLTTPVGGTATLKPDAFVRAARGDFEYLSFVEVDMGTEGRGAIERKLTSYLNYHHSGREQADHGLFPQVVWVTQNPNRSDALIRIITTLPESARRLFRVGLASDGPDLLTTLPDEKDAE